MRKICLVKPLFSILIPAFNNEQTLERALRSILSQTYSNFEVLVSDDCSPENLSELVYSIVENNSLKIKFWRQEENLGVLGNQIFLLKEASGDFCVFLQHDDFFLDNTILGEISGLISRSVSHLFIGNALLDCKEPEMFDSSVISKLHTKSRSGEWYIVHGTDLAKYLCPPVGSERLSLSWSSVFFDRVKLIEKGGFSYKYLTEKCMAEILDVYTEEENMVAFWTLLEEGDVSISPKAISFRGRPLSAFSNSETHPGKGKKNDIEFFNLVRGANLVHSRSLKRALLNRAVSIGLQRINLGIIKYLGFSNGTLLILLRVLTFKLSSNVSKQVMRARTSVYWKSSPKKIILRILNGPPNLE